MIDSLPGKAVWDISLGWNHVS